MVTCGCRGLLSPAWLHAFIQVAQGHKLGTASAIHHACSLNLFPSVWKGLPLDLTGMMMMQRGMGPCCRCLHRSYGIAVA